MASRFAVAWYAVPQGCTAGTWWWECFEVQSGVTSPRSISLGCLGAAPSRGPNLTAAVLQLLVSKMASVPAGSVAVAREVAHA